ncbi:MAG: fumarate hydratase [Candidatus Omnitrophica bacterium]|nr:fumarate hydratase [Candidatus Omnitrophota bacterium]
MKVRFIDAKNIEDTVKSLCIRANTVLRPDVLEAIKDLYRREKNNTIQKDMLGILIRNAAVAQKEQMAICQDTGMVAVFIDMGTSTAIRGDNMISAVDKGVEAAYKEGCFRGSVVRDPLLRDNTGTNTPAVVHLRIVDGDGIKISVMPKGFGSENKSRMIMLEPTAGPEEIRDFCVETVKAAGPDACPPYVLGVGIGGTMEECALLAKRALIRPINVSNPELHIADLEREIKKQTDTLNIGIMGLGGISTVMGVNVEAGPTHIAGLPVAVNLSCHALRSATAVVD